MTDEDAEAETPRGIWARTTAPQSEFTSSQVGTGFVVLLLGLLVTVALPLLLV